MSKYLKYGIMGGITAILSVLLFRHTPANKPVLSSFRNYQTIVDSDTLYAVTEYNSISFHVKGDTLSGLHYELLQAFAESKGLTVDITPEMDMNKRIEGVKEGKFDLLANNELISNQREDSLLLTEPILLSKQVLVQRKPESSTDSTYIKSLLELAHQTLHIVKGAPCIQRIRNLSNEIGDTIYIEEIEKYGQEQLVALVASKDIDYAVCDESIAKSAAEELPEIDIEKAISFTQFYSWGVNRQNTVLLDTLNSWIKAYKQTPAFKELIKKYSMN